jgi:hypothetical protein
MLCIYEQKQHLFLPSRKAGRKRGHQSAVRSQMSGYTAGHGTGTLNPQINQIKRPQQMRGMAEEREKAGLI